MVTSTGFIVSAGQRDEKKENVRADFLVHKRKACQRCLPNGPSSSGSCVAYLVGPLKEKEHSLYNNIDNWLRLRIANMLQERESLEILSVATGRGFQEKLILGCIRKENPWEPNMKQIYETGAGITLEEFMQIEEKVDVIVMLFCNNSKDDVLLKALEIGKTVLIIQKKPNHDNYCKYSHNKTKTILQDKRCTYSKGEIQGTIYVKEACNELLSFLINSGEIPSIIKEDKMDAEEEMEIDEIYSEKMIVKDYLERNFGEHTDFNWQMPYETAEVFCVFP